MSVPFTLPPNSYYFLNVAINTRDTRVRITFESTERVNVYLMTPNNFDLFKQGQEFLSYHYMGVNLLNEYFTITHGGVWVFVIVNESLNHVGGSFDIINNR